MKVSKNIQVTHGRVIFTRSTQPAQYETKKAEVELQFTVREGEELGDALDEVALIVQDKALEMVGLQRRDRVQPSDNDPRSVRPGKAPR